MAIAFAGSTLTATSAGATTVFAINIPENVAADDLLIAQVFTRSSGTADTFTMPVGWTKWSTSNEAAANPRHSEYFWHRQAAGDTTNQTTVTYSSGTGGIGSSLGWYAVVSRWTGVTTAGNPHDVVSSISTAATSNASSNIASPSITLTTGGLTVLKFYATGDDNDLSTFSSPQTSAYDNASYASVRGLDASFACGYFVQASSGASGTHTVQQTTLGFDVGQTFAVALIPAAGGPSPRSAIVFWSELELPLAPRSARVFQTELEAPFAPRSAIIFWGEVETPLAPRSARLFWGEMETPLAPRGALIFQTEFEAPVAPRGANIFWTELEVPLVSRAALIFQSELELPLAPRSANLFWSELEVPFAPRASRLFWSELEVPLVSRSALLFQSELEVPLAPRGSLVFWSELELPNAPRGTQVFYAEFEAPLAPRQAFLFWVEAEFPDFVGGAEPEESQVMTGQERPRDPIFKEPTIGIIRKYGWDKSRGHKSDPFDGLIKQITAEHQQEVLEKAELGKPGIQFRERMLAKQYLNKLQQTETKRIEQELKQQAKQAGLKINVTRPSLNIDDLQNEYQERLVRERAARLRREQAQQLEDEKKLKNKIKMAKVRAAKKKNRRK